MALLTITASFSCTELETGQIYVTTNSPNEETITVYATNGTDSVEAVVGISGAVTFTELPDGVWEVWAIGSVSGQSETEEGLLDCSTPVDPEPACTLAITDVVVTGPTATATVTGTNGVTEFSLDQFDTFQESNILTVEPGNHILYARDKDNPRCIATFIFKVYEVYNPRYSFGFDGMHDDGLQVLIDEKDYTGETEEIDCMGGSPVSIKMSDADILDPIRGTECSLMLQAKTAGQYADLFSADERKYRVRIVKAGALLWMGYLLPNVFQWPHLPPPYDITLTATDGIGDLKQVEFKADNSRFLSDFVSVYDALKLCLYQLDLPLQVLCAVEMIGAGMDEAVNPLKQAQVSYLFAYDGEKIKNSYEVLGQILAAFSLKINQNLGKWFVVPQIATEYSYQEFDQDGSLLGSGVFDPKVEIVPPGEGWPIYVNASQIFNMAPGYKKQEVNFEYGQMINMVPSGDFKDQNPDYSPKGWDVTAQTNAAVFNDFEGQLTLSGTSTDLDPKYAQSPPYLLKRIAALDDKTPIRVAFTYFALRLASAKNASQDVEFSNLYYELKVGNYYAREDGYWQAGQTRILYGAKNVNAKVEHEKLFRQPPVDGNLTIRFYAQEDASFEGVVIQYSNISIPAAQSSGTVSFNYYIDGSSQTTLDRLKYAVPYYTLKSSTQSLKPDNTWGAPDNHQVEHSKEVNGTAKYSNDIPASPFSDIAIEFGQNVTAGFGLNEIKLSNVRVEYGDFNLVSTPKKSEDLEGTNPANYKLVREAMALGLGDAPAGWYANGLYLDKLPIASWTDTKTGDVEQIQVLMLRRILDQTQTHKQVLTAEILGTLHFNAVIWDAYNDQRMMPAVSLTWDLKRGQWSGDFVELIGTAVIYTGPYVDSGYVLDDYVL